MRVSGEHTLLVSVSTGCTCNITSIRRKSFLIRYYVVCDFERIHRIYIDRIENSTNGI